MTENPIIKRILTLSNSPEYDMYSMHHSPWFILTIDRAKLTTCFKTKRRKRQICYGHKLVVEYIKMFNGGEINYFLTIKLPDIYLNVNKQCNKT